MKYKQNIHFALYKHPDKSYRSRHNKSCQGLAKTTCKTLKNEARRPKTEDPLKKTTKKMEICEFYFLVNVCPNFRNLQAVTKTPHQRLKQKREEEIDANM